MLYIEKIIRTIVTVIGVILFCIILGVCCPVLREPLLFWWTTIWAVFKAFFLVDVLKKWLLYILVAGVITTLGFWIGSKQEKKIWMVVSVVFDVIAFIGFWNYK